MSISEDEDSESVESEYSDLSSELDTEPEEVYLHQLLSLYLM